MSGVMNRSERAKQRKGRSSSNYKANNVPTLRELKPLRVREFLDARENYRNSNSYLDPEKIADLEMKLRLTRCIEPSLLTRIKEVEFPLKYGHMPREDWVTKDIEKPLEEILRSICEKLVKKALPKDIETLKTELKLITADISEPEKVRETLGNLQQEIMTVSRELGCESYVLTHETGRKVFHNAFINAIRPKSLGKFLTQSLNGSSLDDWGKEISEYMSTKYLRIDERRKLLTRYEELRVNATVNPLHDYIQTNKRLENEVENLVAEGAAVEQIKQVKLSLSEFLNTVAGGRVIEHQTELKQIKESVWSRDIDADGDSILPEMEANKGEQVFIGYAAGTEDKMYSQPGKSACFPVTLEKMIGLTTNFCNVISFLDRSDLEGLIAKTKKTGVKRVRDDRSDNPQGGKRKQRSKLCYRCGQLDHMAATCQRPPKCTKCDGIGHTAAQCKSNKEMKGWYKRWMQQATSQDKGSVRQAKLSEGTKDVESDMVRAVNQMSARMEQLETKISSPAADEVTHEELKTAKAGAVYMITKGGHYKRLNIADGTDGYTERSIRLREVKEVWSEKSTNKYLRQHKVVDNDPHTFQGVTRAKEYKIRLKDLKAYSWGSAFVEAIGIDDSGADFVCIPIEVACNMVKEFGMPIFEATPAVISQVSDECIVHGVMYGQLEIEVRDGLFVKIDQVQLVVLDCTEVLICRYNTVS